MIKDKLVLAIIPARGGSKGIPGKNIVPVHGKPLIQYTIDAALQSKYIDEIHVSTDDEKIAAIVEKCGVRVPRMRLNHLAQDDSKTIDVIMDVVNYYRSLGKNYEYMILLQPTQPLRQSFHIDEALELIVEKNENSLVSISNVIEHPTLIRKINNEGKLQSILNKTSTVRRQDFEPCYIVNGAIYINKINKELTSNSSLNDNELPYLMDRKYHIDIDNFEDLIEFEEKLKKLTKK